MRYIYYILFIFVVLNSCKKEEKENTVQPIVMDYYPIEVGSSLQYNVVEINIDKDVSVNDTSKYLLKEFIESEYIDKEGNTNYRIERYKKKSNETYWEILNIWYVSVADNSVFKIEDNYRYKKILFPVKEDNAWDGNIENEKETQEYKIISINKVDTIGTKEQGMVLTVLQINDENLIQKQYAVEKYIKNKGLGYKEIINISELEPQPGIPWQQRINVGYLYTQTLIIE